MSTYFDGAKLKQFKTDYSAPRDLLRSCAKHYGLVGTILTLLGAFASQLSIWFYLNEIDSQDLFIPAMLDSKVWGFVIFAGVLLLFVSVLVLCYAIFSTVLILRHVRGSSRQERIGFFIVKSLFIGVINLLVFSVAALWLVGVPKGVVELAAAFLIYLGVVAPLIWFIHKKWWQEPSWWIPWMLSTFFSIIFLVAGGAQVSTQVVKLAGIKQESRQAHYYLVEEQTAPAFRGSDAWKLERDGKMLAAYGYKIFQLSDITVFCPVDITFDVAQNDPALFGNCVRLKSSEMKMMPLQFVPVSTMKTKRH